MALISCKECGKEISSEAEVCPHCGYRQNPAKAIAATQQRNGIGCLGIVGIGLVVLFVLAVIAGGNADKSNPAGGQAYLDLADQLERCSSSQAIVASALQGTDMATLKASLDNAKAACERAAQALRERPLPSTDPVKGPAAIDQMAEGLAEIRAGVDLMHSSPRKARAKAQAGMRTYQSGVRLLNEANTGD